MAKMCERLVVEVQATHLIALQGYKGVLDRGSSMSLSMLALLRMSAEHYQHCINSAVSWALLLAKLILTYMFKGTA